MEFLKKFLFSFLILFNFSFASVLFEIAPGLGLRSIKQDVDLYYVKDTSLGSVTIKPTSISFDRKNTIFFSGKIDLPVLPTIELKYLDYTLHASLTKNTSFIFGNIQTTSTNPADITLDQDTKELDLNFYYGLPFLNLIKLGGGAEVLNTKLQASAKFYNGNIVNETYDLGTLPILYLFSRLNYEKSRFLFSLDLKYLPKVTVKDYNVEYFAFLPQIGIKVFSLPTLKVVTYGNYQYRHLKIEKDASDTDKFYLDRKQNNFELGAYIDFSF